MRQVLTSTALDIEAPGVDRDSGAGIVMAFQAIQAAPPPVPQPRLLFVTNSFSDAGGGNGNGALDPGEIILESVTLQNTGNLVADNVTLTLSTTTPGVAITRPTVTLGNIGTNSIATTSLPLAYRLDPSIGCGTVIPFTLVATSGSYSFTNAFSRLVGTVVITSVATNTFESINVSRPL